MEINEFSPISKREIVNMLAESKREFKTARILNVSDTTPEHIKARIETCNKHIISKALPSGYAHRTRINEYKVYLCLNALTENMGYTRYFSITELKDLIGCSYQSVKNALSSLSEKGRITYKKLRHNKYQAEILSYSYQFRKNGGGYLQLQDSMLSKLLQIDDINAFRICLSQLIAADNNRINDNQYGQTTMFLRKLSDQKESLLVKSLPYYLKPHLIVKKIKNLPSTVKDVFKFNISSDNDTYTCKLESIFDGSKNKFKKTKAYTDELKQYITELNNAVKVFADDYYENSLYNEDNKALEIINRIDLSEKVRENSYHLKNKNVFTLNSECYKSLSYMAISTSIELVKRAIDRLTHTVIERYASGLSDLGLNISSEVSKLLKSYNIETFNTSKPLSEAL